MVPPIHVFIYFQVKKFCTYYFLNKFLFINKMEWFILYGIQVNFITLFYLFSDNHLNWKKCIQQMIPKLRGARCAIRSMVHILTLPLSNQFLMNTFILLKIWNKFLGWMFEQWEYVHFTKENHQKWQVHNAQPFVEV